MDTLFSVDGFLLFLSVAMTCGGVALDNNEYMWTPMTRWRLVGRSVSFLGVGILVWLLFGRYR